MDIGADRGRSEATGKRRGVTQDVGTTPRKRLTPTERLKLFERESGLCCICGLKIRGSFIDEHRLALGLGGSNDPSNRGIAHPKCAEIKTHNEDMPRIVKAKAQKRAQHGIKPEQTRSIQSAGFPVPDNPPKRLIKQLPPRRPIYRTLKP
jgi:5-methylcytosine-specific restriction enzyme A